MKKSFSSKFLAAFMAAVMLFVFGACDNEKKDATVILDQETLTIEEFDSAELTATVTNAELSDIVWTSSDTSKVTVDGGTVYGKSAGTATVTAMVGNASASCDVTVMPSLDPPRLSVSLSETTLIVGESVPVTAVVKYKSVNMETPILWVSADPSVATFADNKITAIKRGSTVITVSAEYLGKQLSKTITITVEDDVSITLDVQSVRLALSNPDGTHITSKTAIAAVYENKVQVTSPEIEWSSSNESIAVVAAGVITPVGAGTTTVTAEYMTTKGYAITAQAEVEVYRPVLNCTGSVDLELTGTNANLDLSEYGITVEGSGDVDVYDTTGTEQKITATLSDNVLTLTVADIHWGLRELEIRKSDVICSINIVAITKIITTADELLQIQTYGGIQATVLSNIPDSNGDGINDYNYSGYFVLGNDIDLTGKTVTSLYWTDSSSGGATKDTFFSKTTVSSDGFSGTFDGRGHTISGGTYSKGGLFGTVSTTGTVKNVAIVGANIIYSDVNLGSYVVISGYFMGTLKDVLIDGIVNDTTPDDGRGANVNSGAFMVFDARYANIENVVIYYENTVSNTATSPICRGLSAGKVPTCINVYVFTDHQYLLGGTATGATWAGVTKYTYTTALSGASVSGLTASFWDLSGDKASFK
jgi:hypothetical protein